MDSHFLNRVIAAIFSWWFRQSLFNRVAFTFCNYLESSRPFSSRFSSLEVSSSSMLRSSTFWRSDYQSELRLRVRSLSLSYEKREMCWAGWVGLEMGAVAGVSCGLLSECMKLVISSCS